RLLLRKPPKRPLLRKRPLKRKSSLTRLASHDPAEPYDTTRKADSRLRLGEFVVRPICCALRIPFQANNLQQIRPFQLASD
ncbi:MAG: hypothetical protein ACKVH8_05525, partial [Pirellulales bacterium]